MNLVDEKREHEYTSAEHLWWHLRENSHWTKRDCLRRDLLMMLMDALSPWKTRTIPRARGPNGLEWSGYNLDSLDQCGAKYASRGLWRKCEGAKAFREAGWLSPVEHLLFTVRLSGSHETTDFHIGMKTTSLSLALTPEIPLHRVIDEYSQARPKLARKTPKGLLDVSMLIYCTTYIAIARHQAVRF